MIKGLWHILSQVQVNPDELQVPTTEVGDGTVQNVLRVVFGVAGAVTFIMVIVGGLKYVLSQGNPQETSKAKGTILYALIGLVISLLAFSIVTFVLRGVR